LKKKLAEVRKDYKTIKKSTGKINDKKIKKMLDKWPEVQNTLALKP
jgi:hypothetical protein